MRRGENDLKSGVEFQLLKRHLEITNQYLRFWLDKKDVFISNELLELVLLSKITEEACKEFAEKMSENIKDKKN